MTSLLAYLTQFSSEIQLLHSLLVVGIHREVHLLKRNVSVLFAQLLGQVSVHHQCPSDRISSVSRGWVSQWQCSRPRRLLLKPDAWVIHVWHRLNILNGSIVVQLPDSWTNTRLSIRLVMDTQQPRLYFASWLQKSCEDSWPSTKPSRTRGKQQIVNTIYHCNAPQTFEKQHFLAWIWCMAATATQKGQHMSPAQVMVGVTIYIHSHVPFTAVST